MNHRRILVIGNGGSGKSTFSIALGEKLHLPVVHLDQIFWKPGWVSVPADEFDQCLTEELNKDAWIIDGNYRRTLELRLKRCDTVIYLDFPRLVCLFYAVKRVIRYHGKTRPDMGEGCPERIDWEFVKWIWHFNRENREKYRKMIRESTAFTGYIVHNRKESRKLIDLLQKK